MTSCQVCQVLEAYLAFIRLCLELYCSWIFIVLAHWNNSHRVDMSSHSDTLSWFRANQSLLFLLNAAYLVEKQLDYVRLSKSNIESLTEQSKLFLCKHLKLDDVREHRLSHLNFEMRKTIIFTFRIIWRYRIIYNRIE